jgi:NTE family protein
MRALLGLVLGAVLLAGCAVRPVNPEVGHYEPGAGYRWSERRALPNNDPKTLLILAFSGGGTRAAAFSYGVLEELRRTQVGAPGLAHTMLSEVDLISSVSGGSFTALRPWPTLYMESSCSTTMNSSFSSVMLRASCSKDFLTR